MLRARLLPWILNLPKSLGVFGTTCFVTATWLFFVDRLLSALRDRSDMAQGLSLGAGAALWASHGIAALALGIPCAILVVATRRVKGVWLPALLSSSACFALGGWLGRSLAAGDWMKQQSFAPAVRFGLPLVLGLGGAALGVLLVRERTRRWTLAALAIASVVLSAADVFVLPDLYPAVHLAFYLLSTVFALATMGALVGALGGDPKRRRIEGAVSLALLVSCVAFWFRMSAETKAEAYLTSAATARIIELASIKERGNVLHHEIASNVEGEPLGESVPSLGWLKGTEDWNVILIVNDALRADTLLPERSGSAPFAKHGDTPFLDSWIASSYRFTRTYSQASRTKRSMPPMFQSTEPSGDTSVGGLPLPRLMADLGKVPLAVVPQYFLMPFEVESRRLLDGFDHIEFFEKDRQETLVPSARELLTSVGKAPFFAWIHFYNMHDPYFAGKLTTDADGTALERYRKGLIWLDGQMKELIGSLDALGIRERTLIVFTGDHGESLGERGRVGHGSGVWDDQTRVPLVISVPGKPGALIDRVVGNIDIVPTMLDLLGRPTLPEHRGRSLVPLLMDTNAVWKRPYYVQNGGENLHGLVHGDQKLVFDERSTLFHRFDLRDVPKETRSIYRQGGVVDSWLVRELVRRNPAILSKEIGGDKNIAKRLAAEIDGLDGDRLTERVDFLLATASLLRDKGVEDRAEALFLRATDPSVKLAITFHLFKTNKELWSKLLGTWIETQTGTAASQIIATLARRGQPAFHTDYFIKKLGELSREPSADWEPWLALVLPWKKSKGAWDTALLTLLDAAKANRPKQEVLRLLLTNVASLKDKSRSLASAVEEYLHDDNALIAAAACDVMAVHASSKSGELLRELAKKPNLDVRVRQATMQALATLEGGAAVPVVIELGQDRLLTVDAIKILGRLKSQRGLPYLEDIVRTHYNYYTRKQAKRAIKAIQKEAERRRLGRLGDAPRASASAPGPGAPEAAGGTGSEDPAAPLDPKDQSADPTDEMPENGEADQDAVDTP